MQVRLVKLLSILFITLGFLVPTSPAVGQDEEPTGASAAKAEDPLLQDAKQYAKTYGLELEEALSRLRLQPAIGRLNAELTEKEGATFAGLWVQHDPKYLIVVQFTPGGGTGLQKLIQGGNFAELYPFIDVRTAERSLRELADIQAAAQKVARTEGVPTESSVDVKENRVNLFTTRPDFLASALQVADKARAAVGAEPLLAAVAIVEVEALSAPARYLNGGHHLTSCTVGFAVQDGGGTKGVITAGHCNSTQAFNTRALPYQSEAYGGSHDVQWHTAPAELHVTNRIWDGLFDASTPNYRFIDGTRPRSLQFIGEVVCKYGMTTGATCGTISSTTFTPGYVPSAAATFIVVTSGTQDQSEPGDSGGPWYSGSTAYGVMSGHFLGNFDAIYMAIDYSTTLGVNVLTTTPALNLGRFTFRAMGDNFTAYTEIDANEYECGLAGFAALDGDILEDNTGSILQAYLTSTNNHFNYRGDFRTHHNSESWDFDLLCLKRSVYSVSRFEFNNLGNNVTYNTGLSTTTYECGVGGMAALDGDIEEHNTGDILQAYLFPSGGTWWFRGDFRTHNNQETWNMHALCVNRAHPVSRHEFNNLGDNVNGYDTFISSSAYECGVAGVAALNGDINEDDSGPIIQSYLFSSGGTWRIRADFRTHNNSETWDIDVLCIQR